MVLLDRPQPPSRRDRPACGPLPDVEQPVRVARVGTRAGPIQEEIAGRHHVSLRSSASSWHRSSAACRVTRPVRTSSANDASIVRMPSIAPVCIALTIIGTLFFFFQAEDGIRDLTVTGVQTCALPI